MSTFSSNIINSESSPPSSTTAAVSKLDQRRGRVSGRLIGLGHATEGMTEWLKSGRNRDTQTGSVVAITFPSMPDVIELARSAEYRVAPIYMAPDGIHQYLNTKPLEIPISFSLSIHDHEYCTHGALTLLATAAKLHTLVLPIGANKDNRTLTSYQAGTIHNEKNDGGSVGVNPTLEQKPTTPPKTDATKDKPRGDTYMSEQDKPVEQVSVNKVNTVTGDETSTYPPIAVLLDLINDGRETGISLGVSCLGYVNQVRTRLKGPWLQPPTLTGKNMPSALECDFTFVHFPSYTNRFAQNLEQYDQMLVNAYAEEVRENFYNLLHKSIGSGLSSGMPSKRGDPSNYRGLTY